MAFFELPNLLASSRSVRWPRPVWPRQLRILLAAPWVEFGETFILLMEEINAAPPGIYKTVSNNGIFTISTGPGFLASTV